MSAKKAATITSVFPIPRNHHMASSDLIAAFNRFRPKAPKQGGFNTGLEQFGAPDDEQRPGLLGSLWNTSLSGLGAVGNILDVPGSMVRDVAAGENPFDQLLPWNLTTDQHRVSGRELNRRYGLAGNVDTYSNWWGGFGTEQLLDPLTYLSFGATGAAKTAAGKLAEAAGVLGDVARVSGKGKRLGAMTTTLADFWRGLHPEKQKALTGVLQRTGHAVDASGKPIGDIAGQVLGKAARFGVPWPFNILTGDVGVEFGKGAVSQFGAGLSDLAGEALSKSYPGRTFNMLFEAAGKGRHNWWEQALGRLIHGAEPQGEIAHRGLMGLSQVNYTDALDRWKDEFGPLIKGSLPQGHSEEEAAAAIHNAFEDATRLFAERPNEGVTGAIKTVLEHSHKIKGSHGPSAWLENRMGRLPWEMQSAMKEEYDAARLMGMTGKDLEAGPDGVTDWFKHFPRYTEYMGSPGKGAMAPTKSVAGMAREEATRLTPWYVMKRLLEDAKYKDPQHGATNIASDFGQFLDPANPAKHADDLAKWAKDKDPMKTFGMLHDVERYHRNLQRVKATVGSIHEFFHDNVDAGLSANGKRLDQAFKELGLDDQAAMNYFTALAGHYGKVNPLAGNLYLPQEIVDAAKTTLGLVGKTEYQSRLLEVIDAATGLFKQSVTLPFPRFISRNFSGGQVINLGSGYIVSAADHAAYMKELYEARRLRYGDSGELFGEGREEFLRNLRGIFGEGAAHQMPVYDEIAQRWAQNNKRSPDEFYATQAAKWKWSNPGQMGSGALPQGEMPEIVKHPLNNTWHIAGSDWNNSWGIEKLDAGDGGYALTHGDDLLIGHESPTFHSFEDATKALKTIHAAQLPEGHPAKLIDALYDAGNQSTSYPEGLYKIGIQLNNGKPSSVEAVLNDLGKISPLGESETRAIRRELQRYVEDVRAGDEYTSLAGVLENVSRLLPPEHPLAEGAAYEKAAKALRAAGFKGRGDELLQAYIEGGMTHALEHAGFSADDAADYLKANPGELTNFVAHLGATEGAIDSAKEIEKKLLTHPEDWDWVWERINDMREAASHDHPLYVMEESLSAISKHLQDKHYGGMEPSDYIDPDFIDPATMLPRPGKELYQNPPAPKGAFQYLARGQKLAHAFQSADLSTFAHETWHDVHSMLRDIDPGLAEDFEKAIGAGGPRTWEGKYKTTTRQQHELGATAWERYLYNGVAPNARVADAFALVKQQMAGVYRSLQGSPIAQQVSPQLKSVFDQLLASDPKAVQEANRLGKLRELHSLGLHGGHPHFDDVPGVGATDWRKINSPTDIRGSWGTAGHAINEADAWMANTFSPGPQLSPAAQATIAPISKAVGRVGSVLGAIPGAKVAKGAGRAARQAYSTLLESASRLNADVEWYNRVPMFNYLVNHKGWDKAAAAAKVNEMQVDYGARHFTPFENEVLRRLIPFYKFQRKVGPALVADIFQRPGGMPSQLVKLSAKGHSKDDVTTPEHIASTASIPLGRDAQGNNAFITGFGLPWEQPLEYLGNFPSPQTALREVASQLTPGIKAPLEWATGQSFFQRGPGGAGRPIEDLDPTLGRTVGNLLGRSNPLNFGTGLEFAFANSPASVFGSTARQLTDPRKTPLQRIANALTGIRVSHVSPAQQDAAVRDKAVTLMRQMGADQFTQDYFTDAAMAGMNPHDRAIAERLMRLKTVLAQRGKEAKLKREASK